VDAARELDRLTRISYERGAGTSLDLVTAGTALRQAQINATVDQFNAAKASVDADLAKATCKLAP
jgi:outer membrane protein TolC